MATQTFVATYAIAFVLLLLPDRHHALAPARGPLHASASAQNPLSAAAHTPAPDQNPPVYTIRILCLYGSQRRAG